MARIFVAGYVKIVMVVLILWIYGNEQYIRLQVYSLVAYLRQSINSSLHMITYISHLQFLNLFNKNTHQLPLHSLTHFNLVEFF